MHKKLKLEFILFPFSFLFYSVIKIRQFFYKSGIFQQINFDIPVIGIGNLSVGGTGKSPHTEFILQFLKESYKTAIISRGYGRITRGYHNVEIYSKPIEVGDEPYLFKLHNPDTQVSVAENRGLGIPQLLSHAPDTQCVIMDDSFQHLGVNPGLKILLTEQNRLYTDDYILPMGLLRDTRSSALKADIIIVTKCDDIDQQKMDEIKSQLQPLPQQALYFTQMKYLKLYSAYNTQVVHQVQSGDSILLVTGIANDQYLIDYLSPQCEHLQVIKYRDHKNYEYADLVDIKYRWEKMEGKNKYIITTEKDIVKWLTLKEWFRENTLPIFVQQVAVRFLKDEEKFKNQIHYFVENFNS